MKDTNKTIATERISFGMLIILFVSIIPIAVLAFYNYPCADDFSASDMVRLAWQNSGSLGAVLKAAWENVVYNYESWSGVFMSVFWTSLQFGIFGEKFYGITTVVTLVLLLAGGFYLGHILLRKYLNADRSMANIVTASFLFTLIQCMPDGNEGLYWHAGVVNYTWAFAFLLLLLGVVLSGLKEQSSGKKVIKGILACALAVFVGGGNYLIALQGSMWMLLLLFLTGIAKSNRKKKFLTFIKEKIWLVLPTICILGSFGASVLAPGNSVRMSYANGMSAVEAILASFKYCFIVPVEEWLTWPVGILLVIVIPFMWKIAGNSKVTFSYPIVMAALGFCMVSAGFTPNLYAQGHVGDGRLANTIYFLWIFWLYVTVFYCLGWLRKVLPMKNRKNKYGLNGGEKFFVYGMLTVWVVLSLLAAMGKRETYIGTLAAATVLSGQAKEYQQENEHRLELLYDKQVKEVVFKGFSDPPELLLFQDVTSNPEEWINQVVAEYYGKESVRCE